MRESLDVDRLTAAMVGPHSPWNTVEIHPRLGSTNAEALRDPRPGRVVLTEHQVSGRGRLARGWQTPDRAALTGTFCVPVPDAAPVGWLPLLTGVAVCEAIEARTGLGAGLKWPNDVLLLQDDERKVCGILCELCPTDALVAVGVGLNVDQTRPEIPVDTGTSLALAGAADTATAAVREGLVAALGVALAEQVRAWSDTGSTRSAAQRRYADRCVTLGREVRVARPGTADLLGVAESIDDEGRLVVGTGSGRVAVSAGDVIHLRHAG